jgi:copper chaperone CopZ
VRAALEEMAGVGRVDYDPGQDGFTVDYDPARTEIAAIFAAVFHAGKKMGRDYLPKPVT